MKKKICCIFNLAPHYNEAIYKLMDQQIDCNFFIGDRVAYSIKLMDYNNLSGFKGSLKYIPLFGNFYWQKGAIKNVFKNYNKFIITGDPYCLSTWLILLFSNLLGKKTYLWTHGWYGKERGIKSMIKKSFFQLSDTILLYGNYAKKLLIDEGFKNDKLIVIYNSMDFKKQLEVRKGLCKNDIYKNYFNNSNPTLVYVGRIEKRKKVELLLEVLYQTNLTNNKYNLVLIGKEGKDCNVDDLISSYGIKSCVWKIGACFDENYLGELIYNADLCVVPGDVGLTAVHSLTYGTPVITHNNFPNQGPEFEAIKPGLTGDFYLENSLDNLIFTINSWMKFSNISREVIRTSCYNIIENYYNPFKQIEVIKSTILK